MDDEYSAPDAEIDQNSTAATKDQQVHGRSPRHRPSKFISKQKKVPYKLFSRQQGAFAFKSEADFAQPFYPLMF